MDSTNVTLVSATRRATMAAVFALCLAADARSAFASSGVRADPHPPVPTLQAVRAGTSIVVDGNLQEEIWLVAPAATEFTQRDPSEGSPATERTEVRVAYDDHAVYFGIRMFDGEPDRITARMTRRDDNFPDADRVVVLLDPRHDHLTGASFEVTAAGVQADDYLYDDTRSDGSWDAVWSSSVKIDDRGWAVEIRIPYSQLRFSPGEQQVWGINVQRIIRRKNEQDWLLLVPKRERGQVSRMAHLGGLDGIRARAYLELLPYTTARGQFIAPSSVEDPFNDGSRAFGGAGLDLKWGMTRSLTLDGTVNPDFGQVELDPDVINLTAFETYYDERRPFFIEGGQIFRNFGRGGGGGRGGDHGGPGGGGGTPQLFYSRRIGRPPQGDADGEYVDSPSATTILGAGKITGKTTGGWSVGLIEAVTAREWARVQDASVQSRVEIEPPTSYTVARVLKEGPWGGFGVLGTNTLRAIVNGSSLEEDLADVASSLGADGYYFLDRGREWLLSGQVSGSFVKGGTSAIDDLQRSSARYFQRPDARTARYDPTRTSMQGWSGNGSFGRQSGEFRVNAAVYAVSPGFEVNDLGFQQRADRFGGDASVSYHKFQPDRFTRERRLSLSRSVSWNFDGESQGGDWSLEGGATFHNYWDVSASLRRGVAALDDKLTRGGPMGAEPSSWGGNFRFFSDSRKPVSLMGGTNYQVNEAGGWRGSANLNVNVKAGTRLTMSVGPNFTRATDVAQYVTSVEDAYASATYGARYVFGRIDQTQFSLQTRLNLLLTPRVSLQMYAQPLLAAGLYSDLKELSRRAAYDFNIYGRDAGTIDYDPTDAVYTIDPDGGGPAASFEVSDPNFNRVSLRMQTVFRWEFRPGSRLYIVWSQQRREYLETGAFDFDRNWNQLFSTPADDVLAVKISYWIGR